jgi:hypothetical protein
MVFGISDLVGAWVAALSISDNATTVSSASSRRTEAERMRWSTVVQSGDHTSSDRQIGADIYC